MLSFKLGIIGSGQMATALARGWVEGGLIGATSISASDPNVGAREAFALAIPGSEVVDHNGTVAANAEVLLLAVKPQQMDESLASVRNHIAGNCLVLSIAAGVPVARLAAGLPDGQRIVRIMPNTPCLIGRGASAYCLGPHATSGDSELVRTLLSAVGVAVEVEERQLDAVTGLSGSGPAFVYTMVEALTEGGVAAGLEESLAARLAAQTAVGAAEMILRTGETPDVLRRRVTSPGGTTLAGLKALEEYKFKSAVVAAVRSATARSRELGGPAN